VDIQLTRLAHHDLAIDANLAISHCLLDFRQKHVCPRDGNGGSNIQTCVNLCVKVLVGEMSKRIKRDNLGGIRPLRLLLDLNWWLRVLKVGLVLESRDPNANQSQVKYW